MKTVNSNTFAEMALSLRNSKIPYKDCDCQGLVKKVLNDLCGLSVQWAGSNDMFRNFCTWTGTISEAVSVFGGLLPGMVVFTVKHDGGEIPRGYDDGFNASHVGIYCGGCEVMESTSVNGEGVKCSAYPNSKWTHCGKLKMVTYPEQGRADTESVKAAIREVIKKLEGIVNDL